jgi:hypothetical protein
MWVSILGVAALLLAAPALGAASEPSTAYADDTGVSDQGNMPAIINFTPAMTTEAIAAGETAVGTYQVPPGIGTVTVSIGAYGVKATTETGQPARYVYVRLKINNQGSMLFRVDPTMARLMDDKGRRVSGADLYAGQTRLSSTTVSPSGRDDVQLGFVLPPMIRFSTIGSFTLIWPYTYGDKRYEGRTKFIRIERVNYYYPDYYYPYGYYHPYPYYYGPWYSGPGYYGYWGGGRHRHH